jgi:hypothetical protein
VGVALVAGEVAGLTRVSWVGAGMSSEYSTIVDRPPRVAEKIRESS